MSFVSRPVRLATLILALFASMAGAAERHGPRTTDPVHPGVGPWVQERGSELDTPWAVTPNAGDYTVTVAPNPIVIAAGGEGRQNFSFTLTSTGGFAGLVTVTITWTGDVIVLEKNCPSNTPCPPPATATYTVPPGGSVGDQAIASRIGPNGGTITITTTTPGLPDKDTPVIVSTNSTPDFFLFPTPGSLTIQKGQSGTTTINLQRTGGFTGDVTANVLVGGGPSAGSGFTFTPAMPVTFAAGESTKQIVIAIDQTVPVDSHTVTFVGSAVGITGTRPCNVIVYVTAPTATPDFTFSATPSPLSVTQDSSTTATLTIARIGGFNGTVDVTATTTASGITIPNVTFADGETSKSVTVSAAANATTDPATITFAATAPALSKTLTAVIGLTVVPSQAPGNFSLTATPIDLEIVAGETNTISLTLSRQNFTGDVDVLVTANAAAKMTAGAADVTITPQSFTFSGSTTTKDVEIRIAPGASSQRLTIGFTATSAALPGITRTGTSGVTVIPASSGAPILTSVTPDAVVAGTQKSTLVFTGRNFVDGAQILSNNPDVVVESTQIQSDSVATAIVTVDPFASPGPSPFSLRNPDSATTPGIDVIVYEEGDIGAPLDVTAAAILSPLGGKIVTNVERPYATGVVATTGSGTITGRWLFDGGTFDNFTITVSAGEPAMVTSRVTLPPSFAGPHQLQLVIDSPLKAESARIQLRTAVDSASNLTILGPVPEAGLAVPGAEPLTLRWSMVPGALGYAVEVTREGEPAMSVETGQEAEVTLDPSDLLAGDGSGDFRWRVAPIYCCAGNDPYNGAASEWTDLRIDESARANRELYESVRDASIAQSMTPRLQYQLANLSGTEQSEIGPTLFAQAAVAAAPSKAPATTTSNNAKAFRNDWSIVPMITSTYTRDADQQDGSTQLSGQADLGVAPVSTKYTTDFTGANIYGDDFTFEGSRNWIVNFGNAKRSKRTVRPEAIVGYGPPDFFRGATLVTSSLARGGGLGRIMTPAGNFAFYSTFTDVLDGVVAGNFGMNQKVEAAAFELPQSKKYSFKLLAMNVEDLPLASQSTPAGEGRSVGFLTTYNLSPKLQLVAEAARGRGEWTTRTGLREREGNAYRFGLNGRRGLLTYRADLNHTDDDYANPGNRGFTTASIPNRTGGSASISRPLGRGAATVAVKHQTQPKPSSTARATGLNLSYNIALKPNLNLSATANTNFDSADADRVTRQPRTDRQQLGGTVTLTQSLGRLVLSESVVHQRLDDDVRAINTNNVTSLTFTGGGTIRKNFDLFSTMSYVLTDAASGDGENLTVSLQPTFAIPSLFLSLQPQVSYNHTTNDLTRSDSRVERYTAMLQWNPQWLQKVGALQLATNWNYNESGYGGRTTQSNDRSYVGTFTLKWGAGVGAEMFRRNQLPGELAITGHQGASQNPVNGKTPAR